MTSRCKKLFIWTIFIVGSILKPQALNQSITYKKIACQELDNIVVQSGFTEEITFLECPRPGGFTARLEIESDAAGVKSCKNVILIDPAYSSPQQIAAHASIVLHEIGHLAHGHLHTGLSAKSKNRGIVFFSLVHSSLALPMSLREEEREADLFMLEKSTKEQLIQALTYFKNIETIEINCRREQAAKEGFFSLDRHLSSLGKGLKSSHPSTKSRIKKIENRIKELECKELEKNHAEFIRL